MPDSDDSTANPLEAVFEKAVRPFADAQSLRAALPPHAPIVLLRKGEELQTEETAAGGVTMRIPVLEALVTSKAAQWHRAKEFDFAAMAQDEIGLLVTEAKSGTYDLKVITRASGDAFLLTDLAGMLDAVASLSSSPLFSAFPGAEMMGQALRDGLQKTRDEMLAALNAPDESGKSFLQQFSEKGGRKVAKKRAKSPKGRSTAP